MTDNSVTRLKKVFEETGWTQKKLALECGYTPQYISYLLNGIKPIQKDCAQTLAKVLNVRFEYLLCYDDYKTERERKLHRFDSDVEQSVKFEELLLCLGYKIKIFETDDLLNDSIIITDDLSFEHQLTEKEFDNLKKEIFDFIEFKIEKL